MRVAIFVSVLVLTAMTSRVSASGPDAPDTPLDGSAAEHSTPKRLPQPRIIYATDFSTDFQYDVPHRYNTSAQAKQIDNGTRVVVDDQVVVDAHGYNSNPGGEKLNARIGIYRDAMPIDQCVVYDDWTIEVLAE